MSKYFTYLNQVICNPHDLVILPLVVPESLVDAQHEVVEVCPLNLKLKWCCVHKQIHKHLWK